MAPLRAGLKPDSVELCELMADGSIRYLNNIETKNYYDKYNKMHFFDPRGPDLGGEWDTDNQGTYRYINNKMMSCCNKAGREKWNGRTAQWECSACGAIKSNDPNYLSSLYTPGIARSPDSPVTIQPEVSNGPRCECGSHKAGSNRHSDYCPLYEK